MTDDHQRGCPGREVTCTCGFDDRRDALIRELLAALVATRPWIEDVVESYLAERNELEALDAAIAKAKAQGYVP